MKFFVTTVSVLIFAIPAVASADPVCMPTGELRAALVDWYAEVPVDSDHAAGLQLYASELNDTWTLVEHRTGGVSCSIITGDDYATRFSQADAVAMLD